MIKTVAEIAQHVGGQIRGDASRSIEGVSSLEHVQPRSLVWVNSERNLATALSSIAAAIILAEPLLGKVSSLSPADRESKALIVVNNPRLAFAKAILLFHPAPPVPVGIDPTARISPTALMGEGVAIGPYVVIEAGARIGAQCKIAANCFVGSGVRVGEACRLYPNVILYPGVTLGARCIVHAGAVIGSEGFGFVPHEGHYFKFPQVGTVVIGDDVEIGANTTIDRGTLDATRIGRGTKIDNLVQIAHNVEIGEDVVIAAQTGISGGAVIADKCRLGGQVGIAEHVRIKRGARIGGQSAVYTGKIIREGQVVLGTPAIPLDEFKVLNALWRGLPKMKKELKALRELVQSAIEKSRDTSSTSKPGSKSSRKTKD